jgi:hypothetical protein
MLTQLGMIPRDPRIRRVVGGILGMVLASACSLGLGGTGQSQGDADAGPPQGSSPAGSQTCTPFATQTCACPGGGDGIASCPASGSGFGACESCRAALDASAHHDAAGNASKNDAAAMTDGAGPASGCSTCLATSCPGAQAACGTGTDCAALLTCDLACAGSDASECSDTCSQMHPTGAMAFATLTICALACGAGCLAESTGPSVDASAD